MLRLHKHACISLRPFTYTDHVHGHELTLKLAHKYNSVMVAETDWNSLQSKCTDLFRVVMLALSISRGSCGNGKRRMKERPARLKYVSCCSIAVVKHESVLHCFPKVTFSKLEFRLKRTQQQFQKSQCM